MDGNNFYKCISFIIFLFLVPGIVNAVDATTLFSSETITFEFNKPKGTTEYFEVNKTLTFYNYNNATSAHISNLTISVNNITGLTISPSKNNFSIRKIILQFAFIFQFVAVQLPFGLATIMFSKVK